MEVEYSLTLEDLQAFERYYQGDKDKLSARAKQSLWQIALYLGLMAVALAWVLAPKSSFLDMIPALAIPFGLGLVAGVIGMGVLMVWLGKIAVRSQQGYQEDEHNRWIFGPHRLRVSPEDLTVTSTHQTMIIQWELVWKINWTDAYVFFWTTSNSAHVVPRRAFREDQHFKEFIALARGYRQGPKSTGILTSLPPESTAIRRPNLP